MQTISHFTKCTCACDICHLFGVKYTYGMVSSSPTTRRRDKDHNLLIPNDSRSCRFHMYSNNIMPLVCRPRAFHAQLQGTRNPSKILCAVYLTLWSNLSHDTTYSRTVQYLYMLCFNSTQLRQTCSFNLTVKSLSSHTVCIIIMTKYGIIVLHKEFLQ
jgi:hypothetical protein